MVFDLSFPKNPRFVQYLNQRNFSQDNDDPYRAPEGVLFISAEDSPTGNPLLVVTYEVSATVVVYEVAKTPVN